MVSKVKEITIKEGFPMRAMPPLDWLEEDRTKAGISDGLPSVRTVD